MYKKTRLNEIIGMEGLVLVGQLLERRMNIEFLKVWTNSNFEPIISYNYNDLSVLDFLDVVESY